jgi:hypothetical protein
MAASTGVTADDIDTLLERYLGLLDEYTKLRAALTDLLSSVYQNIARANFSAERGIRYGQEMFDERMQASRSLAITFGEDETPKFEITSYGKEKKEIRRDVKEDADEAETQDEKERVQKPSDPLRWFGILSPMPLRQAQSKSIQAVEQIMPKLVAIKAEMADVEIRVRRARKKRAKAEAAAMKKLADLDLNDEKVPAKEDSASPLQKDTEVAGE